ncbi:hypothetical protein DIPPA_23553 [Diplonema papillatum]|nr:hypothetical protein DIPPA_23553 [Diplonema papillatum]
MPPRRSASPPRRSRAPPLTMSAERLNCSRMTFLVMGTLMILLLFHLVARVSPSKSKLGKDAATPAPRTTKENDALQGSDDARVAVAELGEKSKEQNDTLEGWMAAKESSLNASQAVDPPSPVKVDELSRLTDGSEKGNVEHELKQNQQADPVTGDNREDVAAKREDVADNAAQASLD